jgi:hypothetical protein
MPIEQFMWQKCFNPSKFFSLFHAIVTPVACFGTGPMAIHSEDLQRLDIYFQKLLTSVVGPPLGISWDAPWHYIVHAWHERVADFVREIRICTWTAMCVCGASIGFCKLCCKPSTRRCGKFYRRGIRPAAFDVEDLRTFGVQNSLDFIDTRQWNIGRMMGKKTILDRIHARYYAICWATIATTKAPN